jgi:single-stranded DNA-binding protein
MTTVTLEGFLGRDRQILDTRERTYTKTWYDTLVEQEVEAEVVIPSQRYARLSLATHERQDGKPITRWHRLIAWHVDRTEFQNVRLARKGDRVRVTGRVESFRTTTPQGETRVVPQVVVDSFHLVKIKARCEYP